MQGKDGLDGRDPCSQQSWECFSSEFCPMMVNKQLMNLIYDRSLVRSRFASVEYVVKVGTEVPCTLQGYYRVIKVKEPHT